MVLFSVTPGDFFDTGEKMYIVISNYDVVQQPELFSVRRYVVMLHIIVCHPLFKQRKSLPPLWRVLSVYHGII